MLALSITHSLIIETELIKKGEKMNNLKTKKEIREQLKKDIEKFVSNGGEVTQVKTKEDFRFGHRNQLSNYKNTNICMLPLSFMLVA